jgi:hypothetical protein
MLRSYVLAVPVIHKCSQAIFIRPPFHRRNDKDRRRLAMTIRIIPILAIAIIIGASLANGSPACMTESEARAKFPKAHLVWLGSNHCWIFGVVRVHSPTRVLAAQRVPSPRAVLDEKERVPSSRPAVIDVTGAQCRYSDAIPCE